MRHLLLLCCLAAACAPGASDSRGGAQQLSGRLLTSSDSLGFPARLAVLGDYVIVLDAFGGPAVHAVRRWDGQYMASYGAKGEGPGEFTAPFGVGADADGFIWVSDPNFLRLTRARLDVGPQGLAVSTEEIVTLEGPVNTYGARMLNDQHIVAMGVFPDGAIGLFDRSGQYIRALGFSHGPDSLPPRARVTLHLGHMVTRPGGDKIVVASKLAGRVRIVDIAGDSVIEAAVPDSFESLMDITPAGHAMYRPDTRHAYGDVYGTEEAIFALFSGKTEGQDQGRVRGGDAWIGNEVQVFDWSGELRGIFTLDSGATGIAISGDTLFATVMEPTPGVRVYLLEELPFINTDP